MIYKLDEAVLIMNQLGLH